MPLLRWSRPAHRRERLADEQEVDALLWSWRSVCVGAGLCHTVSTATGPTDSVPRIVDVVLGPPTVFTVELLPGQIAVDVRAVAHRLAGSLGVPALRVESQGVRHVRVELLAEDPLGVGSVARAQPVYSVLEELVLGDDELGRPVRVELGDSAHLVVQGASGSGKSVGMYGLLGQLAPAPDVRVVGSDITGLLLAPWAARPDVAPGWCALGTRDPAGHVRALGRVVDEMDARIAAMPPGCDSVPVTPACPLLLVVVEEMPGLMRVLATHDKSAEKAARGHLDRIVGEGRKAGIRALLIAQRADANIVGGYARGQASHTISFRVDTLAALAMLHADVDKLTAAEHATAPPGVALLSAPGLPLLRFRAPLTTYQAYCAEVTGPSVADAA